MTTRQLLWGMTWRGAVCGAVIWVLGSFALLLFEGVVVAVAGQYSDADLYAFMVLGVLISLPVPTLASAIIGLLSGILVAIIVNQCFRPLRKLALYRISLAFASVSLYLAGATFGLYPLYQTGLVRSFVPIFHPFIEFIPGRPSWQVDSNGYARFNQIASIVLFLIFVMLCAIFVSHRLARWYERESDRGTVQDAATN